MENKEFVNPFNRETDPLNHDIFNNFINNKKFINSQNNYIEFLTKCVVDEIKSQIDPELLTNYNDLYKELTLMIQDFKKTTSYVEKKTKKLIESSTLCEDVYHIRDEMKVLKKKFDKINRGLKQMSRISIEDDEI